MDYILTFNEYCKTYFRGKEVNVLMPRQNNKEKQNLNGT